MELFYDVIIIGGGPAGYTAALYSKRAGLSTLLLEKYYAGGQMATTNNIENYPGFDDGVDGFELAQKMKAQAEKFGAVTELKEVVSVELEGEIKRVRTKTEEYSCKSLIIATGASPKKLELASGKGYIEKGVHYCATCDGFFYKNKKVIVVGGGDTAVMDAIYLSKIAKEVVLVHRRDSLRATKIYHNELKKLANVTLCLDSVVYDFIEGEAFKGIVVENVKTKENSQILADGIFVAIGRMPITEFLNGSVKLDGNGYVLTDEECKTSINGVYAIGDVRAKSLRQIVTAVADGAIAVDGIVNAH